MNVWIEPTWGEYGIDRGSCNPKGCAGIVNVELTRSIVAQLLFLLTFLTLCYGNINGIYNANDAIIVQLRRTKQDDSTATVAPQLDPIGQQKNLNASSSKPLMILSFHPIKGVKLSKYLGLNVGCKDRNYSWDRIGFIHSSSIGSTV